MGLSGSKTKTSTKPVYSGQIEGAANTVNSTYNANAPALQSIGTQIQGLVPGLIDKYEAGNPSVNAATAYNTDVLGGKYLDAGNPYLQGIVDTTNGSVADQVNALFSRAGQTGSSRQIGELGKQLSTAENNLRYADYNTERGRMDTAAGLAPSLAAADYASIAPILAAAQGATLPVQAANSNASTIGSLLGGYTNGTQTTSQGLGSILGGVIGSGLSGWASGGFKL